MVTDVSKINNDNLKEAAEGAYERSLTLYTAEEHEELSEVASYNDFKEALGQELKKAADSFVKVGYLLRVARDTDILKESEYESVEDFALKEYGLDKSQVSRFIAINERFSEGGYSDHLEAKYEGYGVAKLGIMVQLPDEVNDQLSPNFTKAEINSVKDEIKEENKVTDIERALEPEAEGSFIETVLAAVLKQDPLEFKEIWEAVTGGNATEEEKAAALKEIWAPAGEAIKTVRIPNIGRVMFKVAKGESFINTVTVRTNETESFDVKEIVKLIYDMTTFVGYKESWQLLYDEPYGISAEEKPEVAPVQQKEKPKVTKAEPSKPKKEKTEEERYNEEQARIDRETKKKLEEIDDNAHIEELSKGAPKREPITHEIKLSANFWNDITSGLKKFELRKNDRDYRVGDKLLLMEYKDGEPTGRTILEQIIYMLEDYTGLTEGYAILGIELIEVTEGTDEP